MNAVPPVRRFPRAALLRHMRVWNRFVKKVREGKIDNLPLRLRNYIRANRSDVYMYLCSLERNGNLFPYEQREQFLDFLKEVYLSQIEPLPPNPTQHNPNAEDWGCAHCGKSHRPDRTFHLDDRIEYMEVMGEEGVDMMEIPIDDYR
ncbi:hypothetical protein CRE_01427 [Caenorhabditis remanei]|uniref:Uncharacterized protein n=1 Tax=Caenorhabditis remanei TaxID=31234 RepID=E3NLD5_CAERE|nr:hypothetical protein CRE_01427 [Caenorhabditis remanei]